MKKKIVDTNAFLRYLLNDIPEQKEAFQKLLVKAKKGEVILYVPQIIIFEIQFILDKYYNTQKEEVIDKLKTVVSAKYLMIKDREVFLTALTLYAGKSISFVDCFLLSLARKERAELFTFDQKLKNIA